MPVCVRTGLLCDLLWSDPDKDITGWGDNDRGVSFTFGPDVVQKFLHKHDLDLVCRAHQVGVPKCSNACFTRIEPSCLIAVSRSHSKSEHFA